MRLTYVPCLLVALLCLAPVLAEETAEVPAPADAAPEAASEAASEAAQQEKATEKPETPPVDYSQVKVMAYNVRNMFDVFDDPYTHDEQSPVKPRWELERIATLIKKYDPDVIALTELENEWILKAIIHDWLGGRGYDHITSLPSNDRRGITIGVASRLPIHSVTSHRLRELRLEGHTNKWQFARDLIRARLWVAGRNQRHLDVYVAHFKSKRNVKGDERSRNWRLAEATAARSIVDAGRRAVTRDWTLLVGDFNDTPDSETLKALTDVVDGGPTPLLDVHAHLPPERRITYLRGQFRSTIDYILASPDLARRVVTESAYVPRDVRLLTGSDHAPVLAAFDLSF
ncbi:MAG: hypothetical protein CMJ18_07990 [Phycisphaeraceae bacterium]|nr:hypothetical protein [Phycisphaeraceae bacterium]